MEYLPFAAVSEGSWRVLDLGTDLLRIPIAPSGPASELPTLSSQNISFRDPAGFVVIREGRVFRVVREQAAAEFRRFVNSDFAHRLVDEGSLVGSHELSDEDVTTLLADVAEARSGLERVFVFEHPRVDFISYPYEWSSEMLHAAALFTVRIATEALNEGWILKDATPFNVTFRGARPVFLDVLSFERLGDTARSWPAYGQFVRTFILPLQAARKLSMTAMQSFSSNLDGIEPEQMHRLLPLSRKLSLTAWATILIPTFLGSSTSNPDREVPSHRGDAERSAFILKNILRHVRRLVLSSRPRERASLWSRYSETGAHSEKYAGHKRRFIAEYLQAEKPHGVLDIGCNTGDFSVLAAEAGSTVVSIDTDEASVASLYRRAAQVGYNILPLLVDITDPPPARGWRNAEREAFLERAQGSFEMVMALAILHHVVVRSGIPIDRVISLIADLTLSNAIVEFVPGSDPMYLFLSRNRDVSPATTVEEFRTICRSRFKIVAEEPLSDSGRILFVLQKHPA